MGECSFRKRDVSSFHFWASLFADDCALIFETREDLIAGTDAIYAHLRKFGLNMHVGRGDMASKTEAMFFPKARQSYEEGDTSRFRVGGSGFVEFAGSFKYLGSIIHYSLSADADVDKRIKSASAAFGALRNIFSNRHIDYRLSRQRQSVRGFMPQPAALRLRSLVLEREAAFFASAPSTTVAPAACVASPWPTLFAVVFVRAISAHVLASSH